MGSPVQQPFFKWAGGKAQLVHKLQSLLPADLDERQYVEPFLGGGALFFALPRQVQSSALLVDRNLRLISTYRAVQSDVSAVVYGTRRMLRRHGPGHFERVRKRFNALMDGSHEFCCGAFDRVDHTEVAVMFLYLNKTCFNGLYRENKLGHFNVPIGDASAPEIDAKNLRACSVALQGARIEYGDFSCLHLTTTYLAKFVYFDPPYLSSNGFHSYQSGGFGMYDHVRLFHYCERLTRGEIVVPWLMSQSSVAPLRDLYRDYVQVPVRVRRSIAARGTSRARVGELIIRNYSLGPDRARF